MRVTLPRAWIAIVLGACAPTPPPVAPGPPIPADPPESLGTMVQECDALVGALETFQACTNLDDENREDLDGWIERAQKDFAAGRKATLAPDAQQAIAHTCRRATNSVKAATERCHAGPRPKTD